MVGLAAAAAVLLGVVLPWTTATYLDDIKTKAGSTSPAVIETGVAGLVVFVVAGARIAGRLGGFATAVASCFAAGVVLMGVIDVLAISASTAGGGGPLHLGVGFVTLAASVILLAAYTLAITGRGSRLLLAGLLVLVLVVSTFAGLLAADGVLNHSYNFS